MVRGRMNAVLAGCLAAVLLNAAPARGQEEKPAFVGVKGCRACHDTSPKDHYHDWLATKHAQAFDVLKGKEKTDPKCLSCHTTGHGGRLAQNVAAKDLAGVQCEACHGPGSLYRTQSVMKDKTEARAKGLVIPTRKVCELCHK